jgi:hypothetical protein
MTSIVMAGRNAILLFMLIFRQRFIIFYPCSVPEWNKKIA